MTEDGRTRIEKEILGSRKAMNEWLGRGGTPVKKTPTKERTVKKEENRERNNVKRMVEKFENHTAETKVKRQPKVKSMVEKFEKLENKESENEMKRKKMGRLEYKWKEMRKKESENDEKKKLEKESFQIQKNLMNYDLVIKKVIEAPLLLIKGGGDHIVEPTKKDEEERIDGMALDKRKWLVEDQKKEKWLPVELGCDNNFHFGVEMKRRRLVKFPAEETGTKECDWLEGVRR